jgi:hypothetical protein
MEFVDVQGFVRTARKKVQAQRVYAEAIYAVVVMR